MLPVLKYNGVEIAKDIEFSESMIGHTFGLMFRKNIPYNFARIFVLKRPSCVHVHMLFMFFPIDVIFLNEKKKISGLASLNPWTGYKIMKNIKYVIEMKAGTIIRYNLCMGGQMEFEEK